MTNASEAALQELISSFFKRNGYVRIANRRERDTREYRKGFEARLVSRDDAELVVIQGLLSQAGFRIAKPFRKGRQIIQPVYGRAEVQRLLAAAGRYGAEDRIDRVRLSRLNQPVWRGRAGSRSG